MRVLVVVAAAACWQNGVEPAKPAAPRSHSICERPAMVAPCHALRRCLDTGAGDCATEVARVELERRIFDEKWPDACADWARAIPRIEDCASCCGAMHDEVLEHWSTHSMDLAHADGDTAATCRSELEHLHDLCD